MASQIIILTFLLCLTVAVALPEYCHSNKSRGQSNIKYPIILKYCRHYYPFLLEFECYNLLTTHWIVNRNTIVSYTITMAPFINRDTFDNNPIFWK